MVEATAKIRTPLVGGESTGDSYYDSTELGTQNESAKTQTPTADTKKITTMAFSNIATAIQTTSRQCLHPLRFDGTFIEELDASKATPRSVVAAADAVLVLDNTVGNPAVATMPSHFSSKAIMATNESQHGPSVGTVDSSPNDNSAASTERTIKPPNVKVLSSSTTFQKPDENDSSESSCRSETLSLSVEARSDRSHLRSITSEANRNNDVPNAGTIQPCSEASHQPNSCKNHLIESSSPDKQKSASDIAAAEVQHPPGTDVDTTQSSLLSFHKLRSGVKEPSESPSPSKESISGVASAQGVRLPQMDAARMSAKDEEEDAPVPVTDSPPVDSNNPATQPALGQSHDHSIQQSTTNEGKMNATSTAPIKNSKNRPPSRKVPRRIISKEPIISSKTNNNKNNNNNKKKQQQLGEKLIYSSCDVLLGRGGLGNRHSGNRVFRRLVDSKKDMYRQDCTDDRGMKNMLIRSVFMAVKSVGGRFLRKQDNKENKKQGTGGGTGWVEVDDRAALTKIGQAFREPDKRGKGTRANGGSANAGTRTSVLPGGGRNYSNPDDDNESSYDDDDEGDDDDDNFGDDDGDSSGVGGSAPIQEPARQILGAGGALMREYRNENRLVNAAINKPPVLSALLKKRGLESAHGSAAVGIPTAMAKKKRGNGDDGSAMAAETLIALAMANGEQAERAEGEDAEQQEQQQRAVVEPPSAFDVRKSKINAENPSLVSPPQLQPTFFMAAGPGHMASSAASLQEGFSFASAFSMSGLETFPESSSAAWVTQEMMHGQPPHHPAQPQYLHAPQGYVVIPQHAFLPAAAMQRVETSIGSVSIQPDWGESPSISSIGLAGVGGIDWIRLGTPLAVPGSHARQGADGTTTATNSGRASAAANTGTDGGTRPSLLGESNIQPDALQHLTIPFIAPHLTGGSGRSAMGPPANAKTRQPAAAAPGGSGSANQKDRSGAPSGAASTRIAPGAFPMAHPHPASGPIMFQWVYPTMPGPTAGGGAGPMIQMMPAQAAMHSPFVSMMGAPPGAAMAHAAAGHHHHRMAVHPSFPHLIYHPTLAAHFQRPSHPDQMQPAEDDEDAEQQEQGETDDAQEGDINDDGHDYEGLHI